MVLPTGFCGDQRKSTRGEYGVTFKLAVLVAALLPQTEVWHAQASVTLANMQVSGAIDGLARQPCRMRVGVVYASMYSTIPQLNWDAYQRIPWRIGINMVVPGRGGHGRYKVGCRVWGDTRCNVWYSTPGRSRCRVGCGMSVVCANTVATVTTHTRSCSHCAGGCLRTLCASSNTSIQSGRQLFLLHFWSIVAPFFWAAFFKFPSCVERRGAACLVHHD